VKRMIKDAELHADEDRKMKELITARNHADNMIHATEKSLQDLGEQVATDEKSAIQAAIEALKEAVKTDDKAAIEEKTKSLAELSGKLAERVYAQKSASESDDGNNQGSSSKPDDGVVDAEFEEVKEDDKT
jgi:molecular chaperone DnaK